MTTHPTRHHQEQHMPDRPYTDDDLRTEAARQHATLTEDPDFMGTGEMMQDSEVESLTPQHEAKDVDGQPNDADGTTWDDLLQPLVDDGEAYNQAQRKIHGLITGAADVSEWAIDLGADGLEPSTEHEINIDVGGGPIARIHFAYKPDMPDEMRAALVEGLEQALADAEASLDEPDPYEQGDSDSDVFALISGIAGRLRDATDSGEYHAVGLIYDLANGRTTIADAREQLAEITFRHV